jgi:hypothetical protein
MTTIFDVIFTYKIAGILPLWIPIVLFVIGFIIWLIITRKPRVKEFKPINMKEEIKKDFDMQYKYFATHVGKPIYSGLTKVGIVAGYMPLVWNKRHYYKMITKRIKGEDKVIEVRTNEQGAAKTTAKIKVIDEPVSIMCFKVYLSGFFRKIIAMVFGAGMRYFIVDESEVNIDEDSIKITQGMERQYFFGQFIFSKASKSLVDNTSFRIDRENQLQEIANQIPRTVFFDTEMSKRAIAMREAAQIDAEKFRSQKESQQD